MIIELPFWRGVCDDEYSNRLENCDIGEHDTSVIPQELISSNIWALFPSHAFPDLHNPVILLMKCVSASVNSLLGTH